MDERYKNFEEIPVIQFTKEYISDSDSVNTYADVHRHHLSENSLPKAFVITEISISNVSESLKAKIDRWLLSKKFYPDCFKIRKCCIGKLPKSATKINQSNLQRSFSNIDDAPGESIIPFSNGTNLKGKSYGFINVEPVSNEDFNYYAIVAKFLLENELTVEIDGGIFRPVYDKKSTGAIKMGLLHDLQFYGLICEYQPPPGVSYTCFFCFFCDHYSVAFNAKTKKEFILSHMVKAHSLSPPSSPLDEKRKLVLETFMFDCSCPYNWVKNSNAQLLVREYCKNIKSDFSSVEKLKTMMLDYCNDYKKSQDKKYNQMEYAVKNVLDDNDTLVAEKKNWLMVHSTRMSSFMFDECTAINGKKYMASIWKPQPVYLTGTCKADGTVSTNLQLPDLMCFKRVRKSTTQNLVAELSAGLNNSIRSLQTICSTSDGAKNASATRRILSNKYKMGELRCQGHLFNLIENSYMNLLVSPKDPLIKFIKALGKLSPEPEDERILTVLDLETQLKLTTPKKIIDFFQFYLAEVANSDINTEDFEDFDSQETFTDVMRGEISDTLDTGNECNEVGDEDDDDDEDEDEDEDEINSQNQVTSETSATIIRDSVTQPAVDVHLETSNVNLIASVNVGESHNALDVSATESNAQCSVNVNRSRTGISLNSNSSELSATVGDTPSRSLTVVTVGTSSCHATIKTNVSPDLCNLSTNDLASNSDIMLISEGQIVANVFESEHFKYLMSLSPCEKSLDILLKYLKGYNLNRQIGTVDKILKISNSFNKHLKTKNGIGRKHLPKYYTSTRFYSLYGPCKFILTNELHSDNMKHNYPDKHNMFLNFKDMCFVKLISIRMQLLKEKIDICSAEDYCSSLYMKNTVNAVTEMTSFMDKLVDNEMLTASMGSSVKAETSKYAIFDSDTITVKSLNTVEVTHLPDAGVSEIAKNVAYIHYFSDFVFKKNKYKMLIDGHLAPFDFDDTGLSVSEIRDKRKKGEIILEEDITAGLNTSTNYFNRLIKDKDPYKHFNDNWTQEKNANNVPFTQIDYDGCETGISRIAKDYLTYYSFVCKHLVLNTNISASRKNNIINTAFLKLEPNNVMCFMIRFAFAADATTFSVQRLFLLEKIALTDRNYNLKTESIALTIAFKNCVLQKRKAENLIKKVQISLDEIVQQRSLLITQPGHIYSNLV